MNRYVPRTHAEIDAEVRRRIDAELAAGPERYSHLLEGAETEADFAIRLRAITERIREDAHRAVDAYMAELRAW